MKYGFVGWQNGKMIYRLRYTNKILFNKVLEYFKNVDLHGRSYSYCKDGYEVFVIEVETLCTIPIQKAKLITIEETIVKLNNKKKVIQQNLF